MQCPSVPLWMFDIFFISSLELKWESNIQSNLSQPLLHKVSTRERLYSNKLCRSYAPYKLNHLSFIILHQPSACHCVSSESTRQNFLETSFTCCWHNLMCRYAYLQNKFLFHLFPVLILFIFNISCILVFVVTLYKSYCLSGVGMWASSLSWQFESQERSSLIISQFLNEHRQSHLNSVGHGHDKMSSFLLTGSVYLNKETEKKETEEKSWCLLFMILYALFFQLCGFDAKKTPGFSGIWGRLAWSSMVQLSTVPWPQPLIFSQ